MWVLKMKKSFLFVALFAVGALVAEAKGKSRVVVAPETALQVRNFSIRPEGCASAKLADGGVCKSHFVLTVSACAVEADAGVSQVCNSAVLRVDGKSAAVKELWDAARPVWEKSAGF